MQVLTMFWIIRLITVKVTYIRNKNLLLGRNILCYDLGLGGTYQSPEDSVFQKIE